MNRLSPLRALLIALPLLVAAPLAQADKGQELVNGNCKSCHDESVYTRENRRVKDIAGLGTQVRRCEQALGLTWFDEDINAVVNYLNVNYYKF